MLNQLTRSKGHCFVV